MGEPSCCWHDCSVGPLLCCTATMYSREALPRHMEALPTRSTVRVGRDGASNVDPAFTARDIALRGVETAHLPTSTSMRTRNSVGWASPAFHSARREVMSAHLAMPTYDAPPAPTTLEQRWAPTVGSVNRPAAVMRTYGARRELVHGRIAGEAYYGGFVQARSNGRLHSLGSSIGFLQQ